MIVEVEVVYVANNRRQYTRADIENAILEFLVQRDFFATQIAQWGINIVVDVLYSSLMVQLTGQHPETILDEMSYEDEEVIAIRNMIEQRALGKYSYIDKADDKIWETVQDIAKSMGVKNLSNDEFTNEDIMNVRNEIVDELWKIKEERMEERGTTNRSARCDTGHLG